MDRRNRRGGDGTNRNFQPSSSTNTSNDSVRGSGLLDPLTSVDEQLESVNATLAEIATLLESQGTGGDGADGSDEGLVPRFQPPVYPFDFSTSVTADTPKSNPETATFTAPADGTVRRVILGWPLGTQQAVGIGLDGPDEAALIPRGPAEAEYIGFDDKVLSFNLNEDLQDDDEINIRFINNDSQDHFVNVDIFFQEDGVKNAN